MDVISVHVPKTAGSTFGALLDQVYGMRLRHDYEDLPMNPLSRYTTDHEGWRTSAKAEVASISPDIRAIHGHFPVEKYNDAFPEARRIAWVRHPAQWVISLYFFWRNIPTTTHPLVRRLHAENLSIEEFAQDPTVRNRVSRVFLKGVEPEAFAFLGVQEHFEADLAHLIQMMGWPEADPGFVNQNAEPGYQGRLRELHEDDRLMGRLVSWNEEDMDLYEKAVRLRARRLDQSKARLDRRARQAAIRHGDRQPRDHESEVA